MKQLGALVTHCPNFGITGWDASLLQGYPQHYVMSPCWSLVPIYIPGGERQCGAKQASNHKPSDHKSDKLTTSLPCLHLYLGAECGGKS